MIPVPVKLTAAGAVLLLASCNASWRYVKRDPMFRPTPAEPVRVAVLPFEDKSGGNSVLYYPFLPFIYLASLVTFSIPDAPPDSVKGAETLRELLIARLGGSAIRVVSSRAVLTTLHHRGLLEGSPRMDPVELGKILGVDAVLYGELLDWAGHYYVVESRTVVEARIRLVSTLDRRELLTATIGVTDRAGVTGGPTGYIGAAATPVAALAAGPYADLAHEWADLTTKDLLLTGNATNGTGVIPVDPVPFVAAAAVAPPRNGVRYLEGELLEVVALGAPGCKATFDVGGLRASVPMVETARTARPGAEDEVSAVYQGHFYVSATDRADGAAVRVTLESSAGRATAVVGGERVKILTPSTGGGASAGRQ